MINHGTSWCFQSVSCVFLPLESDHFPHRIWQIWESWSIFPPRDVFLLVRFSAEEDLRRLTFGTYQSWVQVVQSGFSYHSSCCQAENLKVKIEHPCQVGVFCLSSGQGEAVWSHGYSWCYLMNLFSLLGTSWSYNQSFPAACTRCASTKAWEPQLVSVRLRCFLATKMGTGAGEQFRHRGTSGPQRAALEQLGCSRGCDYFPNIWCIN